MLEILISILTAWVVSVVVSVILVVVSLIVYTLDAKRQNYINEHFGIRKFFNNVRSSGRENLVLLFLLIPLLNLILAVGCLMAFCTDIGDNV